MKILFKKVNYGADKDTIIAVDLESKFGDYYMCYQLFKEWQFKDKAYIQRECCNAKEKEYLSLLTKLRNEGNQIEIVKSLKG